MKVKKLLSIVLMLTLLAGLFAVSAGAAYSDTDGHWGKAAIDRWTASNIVGGFPDGGFHPDEAFTRAQVATVMSKLLGLKRAKTVANDFVDLEEGVWYTDAMMACCENGIFEGYGQNRMGPNDPITREQLAKVFSVALGIAPALTINKTFADANEVAAWAISYVYGMVNKGYINGAGDKLAPKGEATRAAALTMLDNIVSLYANVAGSYTADDAEGIVLVAAQGVTVTGTAGDVIVTNNAAEGKTVLDNLTAANVTVAAADAEVVLSGTKADSVYLAPASKGAEVSMTKAEVASVVTASDSAIKTDADTKVAAIGAIEGASLDLTFGGNTEGLKLTVDEGAKLEVKDEKGEKIDTPVETETAHNWKVVDKEAASCYVEGYILRFCGVHNHQEKEVLPKLEHKYDKGVVTTAATATTDGVKTFTCSLCGNTYTEVIPATGEPTPPPVVWVTTYTVKVTLADNANPVNTYEASVDPEGTANVLSTIYALEEANHAAIQTKFAGSGLGAKLAEAKNTYKNGTLDEVKALFADLTIKKGGADSSLSDLNRAVNAGNGTYTATFVDGEVTYTATIVISSVTKQA